MRCPALLEHLSGIYGEPVIPFPNQAAVGQVNYGKVGEQRNVDQWHFDSVTVEESVNRKCNSFSDGHF